LLADGNAKRMPLRGFVFSSPPHKQLRHQPLSRPRETQAVLLLDDAIHNATSLIIASEGAAKSR
jgi:hypothetical protein